MKIVLATGNKGKLAEFRAMFERLGHEIVPQSEYHVVEAEETGLSFIENALIKARNAARATGLPALADDSGLAVQALDGAPGIYSARYAGENASDEDNISKILEALDTLPEDERGASFICALAFVRHALDPVPVIALGQWKGRILEQRSGDQGFGYDPVFYVPEEGCAAAQLPKERKNALSHRAIALQSLLGQMQDLGLV